MTNVISTRMVLAAGLGLVGSGVAFGGGPPVSPLSAFGVTSDGRLVSWNVATPGTLSSNVSMTGWSAPSEFAVAIDARPATGELFVISNANRMYSVLANGTLTAVGTGFTPGLGSSLIGMDFNPTVDRIRVVDVLANNRRLNPVTGGAVATDTSLTYADSTPQLPITARVSGTAYSDWQWITGAAAGTVRQFVIDSGRNALGQVGSMAGGNNSFNGGVITVVGSLGVDIGDVSGLDVYGPTNQAFMTASDDAVGAQFYSVNLNTGAATLIGSVQGGDVLDFTVVPTPGVGGAMLVAAGLVGRRVRRR